jgi:Ca2+-binding EF-hand superfamily protein
MSIERCDKCGKAFMSQSEVERHKMYEHPVPVSPFEERFASDIRKNKGNMNSEDLQKMTSDITTGKTNNNNNNDITTISSRQMRKVPFRTFRA